LTTYLFLYTEAPTRRAIARARPGRLVLASDLVTDEDRATWDECVLLPPPDRVEETLGVLDRVRADRVVAQTEYALLVGSLLARQGRLAAPSLEAAHLCTNKWASRLALAAAGVPVPAFSLARTAEDVRREGRAFPLVLKPVASCLGRHVVLVRDPADLDDRVDEIRRALPEALDVRRLLAFARATGVDMGCDPTRDFLVEDYALGPALETDGLVWGREVDLFGATEQVVRGSPRFYFEGYLHPADAPGGIEASSRRALEAVGLTDSGFSIEFRGETLIEVNGRLGEDEGFPDLFRAARGVAPIVEWATGERRASPGRERHAIAYANRYEEGTVVSAHAPEGVTLVVGPGSRIEAFGSPEFAPHVAWTLASHPTSSRAAYEAGRRRLEGVRVEYA
jgi:hypothetical protein